MRAIKRIPYILIAFIGVMLTSCEKDVNLSLPQSKPKLVINSGVTSDSTWKVYIGRTVALFDKTSSNEVDDAEVTIKSEGETIRLQSEGNGIYTSPLKPTIGTKYTIEAKAAGFATATASCVVPPRPSFGNISIRTTESSYKKVVEISITIDDPSGTNDYYIIETRNSSVTLTPPDYRSYWYYYLYTEDIFCENVENNESGYQLLFKDVSFNGNKRKIVFTLETAVSDKDDVECIVKRCSKDFYEYKRTYILYNEYYDSPFTQPIQIHSNVTNGVGIFGAYSSTIHNVSFNQNPI